MKIIMPLTVILVLFGNFSLFADDRAPVFETIGQEPYSFTDENGNIAGYNYEIANAILQEAGYKTKAKPAPMKRLLRNVKLGTTDCMLAAYSPYSAENYTLIEETGHDLHAGLLPRAGINLSSYEDLKGLRIGVPAGMTIGEPFDSDDSLSKFTTPNYPKSTVMMRHKRIDVIMGAIESIKYSGYKENGNVRLDFGTPLITDSFKLALLCNNEVSKSKMVKKLKSATVQLRENGTIDRIIRKFFAPIH